jgi:hypothetical protein
MMRSLAFIVSAALGIVSVQVQAGTIHKESGIELPTKIDGLSQVESRASQSPLSSVYSFADNTEAVTIYIFRATHPNAALWFERADAVLRTFGQDKLDQGSPPREFAFAGSPTPNGLVRTYKVQGSAKSTGLAVGEINSWIVKVRMTSNNLEPDQLSIKLDSVLASFKILQPLVKARPLLLPEPCSEEASKVSIRQLVTGVAIPKPKSESILTMGMMLVPHAAATAGGPEGLASKPETFCRQPLDGGGDIAALYRPKAANAKEWTILFADSGRSISGIPTMLMENLASGKVGSGGMLVVNALEKVSAIMAFEDIPAPEVEFPFGAQFILRGGAELTSVAFGTSTVNVSMPSEKK